MLVNIGKGIERTVDETRLGFEHEDDMSDVSRHVIYLGLRNMLMDSHASIKADDPDCVAKCNAIVDKKLAAMYSGEIRVAGSREGDPVRAEAKRRAFDEVKAWIKSKGRKIGKDAGEIPHKVAMAKAIEIMPKHMEAARAAVEARKASVATLDFDMSELTA